jgi:hypothetical protein
MVPWPEGSARSILHFWAAMIWVRMGAKQGLGLCSNPSRRLSTGYACNAGRPSPDYNGDNPRLQPPFLEERALHNRSFQFQRDWEPLGHGMTGRSSLSPRRGLSAPLPQRDWEPLGHSMTEQRALSPRKGSLCHHCPREMPTLTGGTGMTGYAFCRVPPGRVGVSLRHH